MSTQKRATLSTSTQFDSGAIEVVSLADPQDIQLNIRADQGVNGLTEFAKDLILLWNGMGKGVYVTLD